MNVLKRFAIVLLAALPMLFTGCQQSAVQNTPHTVSAFLGQTDLHLDPSTVDSPGSESILGMLYEGLMRKRSDGKGGIVISNGIAKNYEITDNYDGTVTYTFDLRSAARWSDGKSVTAEDFAFAWQRLADPAVGSPHHELLSMVKGYDDVRSTGDPSLLAVEAKDKQTFCVTLSYPCTYFIDSVCTEIATAPVRADIAWADVNWSTNPATPTNGLYCIESWDDTALHTIRNKEYYERRIHGPDSLRFVRTNDAWGDYQNGTLDIACFNRLPNGMETFDESTDSVSLYSFTDTQCVIYNYDTELFSNALIRRAFDLTIDRSAIATAANPAFVPADGLIPPGIVVGDSADFRASAAALCPVDTEGYPDRCAQARELLEKAGYPAGENFPSVEFLFVASETNYAVARALVEMWQDMLGVNVLFRAVSAAEYQTALRTGNFTIAAYELSPLYRDASAFLSGFRSTSSQNVSLYSNETFDLLLSVADVSEEANARTAFLHDAEIFLLEDTAVSPLYFERRLSMLQDHLSGIYTDGIGRFYLDNISVVVKDES